MHLCFAPGELMARAEAVTVAARATGALQPIATSQHWVQDRDVAFCVRMLAGAQGHRAAQAKRRSATVERTAPQNPFLPYEPELFVADISSSHLCLLNKFTVIHNHLLIVTRAFEEQEAPLTVADFAALWACMGEGHGLGFYNAGKVAGASQRHKHLQLVPLAACAETASLPMAPLLQTATAADGRCPALPFAHYCAANAADHRMPVAEAAVRLHACYRQMLQRAGLVAADAASSPGPYNLLLTDAWMLLVPRGREAVEAISVNALGFAGCLLVRDTAQLALLQAMGPLNLLAAVAAHPHREGAAS